mmetsp:Transcript_19648/g.28874  ORF Transcript_19648/g.28874 Transcript_19648/m.28874 type:complete len:309 (-) Transcript_19648:104-1030(-)
MMSREMGIFTPIAMLLFISFPQQMWCAAFSPHQCTALHRLRAQKGPSLSSKYVSFNALKLSLLPKNEYKWKGSMSLRAVIDTEQTRTLATGLGYLVGAGSLALYTPIAVRLALQKNADGLTLSTWWLKIVSYTGSVIYAYSNEYPISTYVETLIITAEASVILFLVAYFQRRFDRNFVGLAVMYVSLVAWLLGDAPPEVVALGQASSALLNTAAILPQIALNYKGRTSGDYSPVTAGLAGTGCFIRIFTTMQLADADPVLLWNFGIALIMNFTLLAQILWFGLTVEENNLRAIFTSDLGSGKKEKVGV